MQKPGMGRNRDSPDSEDEREYRPGVHAIVDAVEASKRIRNRHPPIPEQTATPDNDLESGYMSPELGSLRSSGRSWRRSRQRQRVLAAVSQKDKNVTPVERRRRLEDMRDREDEAAYNSSRLTARLEILDTFINNALVDDSLMARQEMNPWRFRRNENLSRRWKFVHNVMATQELIDAIRTAKERKAESSHSGSQVEVDKRGSPDGESDKSRMKDPSPSPTGKGGQAKNSAKENSTVDKTEEDSTAKVESDPAEDSVTAKDEPPEEIAVRSPTQLPSINSASPRPERKASTEASTSADEPNECGSSPSRSVSAQIIFGFGSHHRRDMCDYCGWNKCPGMRNRGRKRGGKQTSGGSSSRFLNERKNDIEGIYDTPEKASNRVRKRLVKRMEQLGLD